MKRYHWRITLLLLSLAILLTACNAQSFPTPTVTLTATDVPTSMETLTPFPTQTITPTKINTPTLTFTPTQKSMPESANLTGTISLQNTTKQPFVTTIEIRESDSFSLMGTGTTDLTGVYEITNIKPGIYELWILITLQPLMISGCDDIAPPDDTWRIGIVFGENKAMSMGNAYLSKALLLSDNLDSSVLKAQGFYAVLTGFQIMTGMDNKMDITLQCK